MVISLTSVFIPQPKNFKRKAVETVNVSAATRISIHVRRPIFNPNWSPEKAKH